MFRMGSRVSLAAVAAALLAAAPASAVSVLPSFTAASTGSAQSTFTIIMYYSNASRTTVVGSEEYDCDGNYTMTGYKTSYSVTKTGQCPT